MSQNISQNNSKSLPYEPTLFKGIIYYLSHNDPLSNERIIYMILSEVKITDNNDRTDLLIFSKWNSGYCSRERAEVQRKKNHVVHKIGTFGTETNEFSVELFNGSLLENFLGSYSSTKPLGYVSYPPADKLECLLSDNANNPLFPKNTPFVEIMSLIIPKEKKEYTQMAKHMKSFRKKNKFWNHYMHLFYTFDFGVDKIESMEVEKTKYFPRILDKGDSPLLKLNTKHF